MNAAAKIKDACGYCSRTPFWSDLAAIGFFLLGSSLGIVLGMILMKYIQHVC